VMGRKKEGKEKGTREDQNYFASTPGAGATSGGGGKKSRRERKEGVRFLMSMACPQSCPGKRGRERGRAAEREGVKRGKGRKRRNRGAA